MQRGRPPDLPPWYLALGVVPVVTFVVTVATTGGDPVAALPSAFGAQRVVAWLAEVSLRRGGVHPRRAEVLAERAAAPRWLDAPTYAVLVWVAVDLVGRVRADPGDWWSWGFLALAALLLLAVAVDLARRGVRAIRSVSGARAADRAVRRGARVA